MKKKVRKYAGGGESKFERGTYERARAMLRDNPATADELTPSLDDRIARARERIAGVMQSMPEPVPSRSDTRPASRPAVSQDRPAYPTARRVAEESRDTEDADRGRAMQSAAVRSRIIPSAPTAVDRNDADEGANLRRAMQSAEVSVPPAARSLTPQRSAVDETQMVLDRGGSGPKPSRIPQNTMGVRAAQQMEEKGSIYSPDYGLSRAAREQKQAEREAEARGRESDTRERERQAQEERDRRKAAARLRDEVKGQAKQDMLEREMPKPSRIPQNTMGVRAAQQMEEKGSIYSPDYGLSRAEREAKKEREAEARGRQSDTRERERQAQEERDRRKAAERIRETTRAEVRNSRSATPPVPPPGTRAFANRRRRDLAGPAMTGSPGFKSGGMVGSASKRADGIAQKGKTKGRLY